MKEIKICATVGDFAEDKDLARQIRVNRILPSLEKEDKVVLNFEGVESATQSFIHALLSDVIRRKGIDILDKLYFKGCNQVIKNLINIVVDYMQDDVEIGRKSEGI